MELIEHRCKRCGGELKNISEGRWSCPYCSCVYDEAVVQKNTKSLHEEFDEVKREIVCNLRRNLYDAVNEEYISSEKVRECATELKKYLPVDFAACFYEVAVGNNVKQLTKYIRKINVEENYSEIECVIRFLIKSLQTEYLLELNNLVERAYKQRDLVLFEKYSTEISLEAEKVEDGVYETKMPRDVFIAYSSKDMETVSELCEVLEGQGLKCFVAARNLRHGKGSVENYDRLLCEAMDHSKSFVFVSSTNSRSFSCDALIKELPYIQERDIENAPAEHKNNYASMPHSYKKPRVEYRIEESRGFSAPDAISNEFFDGYERVYSPEAVAERVAKQLLSAAEKKAVKKPTPAPTPTPVVVQSEPVHKQKKIKVRKPKKPVNKKLVVCLTVIPIAIVIIALFAIFVLIPRLKYNYAKTLLENGNYEVAYSEFEKLDGYSDSENMLLECRYVQAIKYRDAGDYELANKIFESLGNYRDSKILIHKHDYRVVSRNEATCTVAGSEIFECSGCKDSYTNYLNASHKYVVSKTVDSTCTATGSKEYKCSLCNHTYSESIAKKSHSFSAATCTSPQICSVCKTTSGKALGHTDSLICTRCGINTFEKLTFSGYGPASITNINLPAGTYNIILTHSGRGNFIAHFTGGSYSDTLIVNEIGAVSYVYQITSSDGMFGKLIKNGFINITNAGGDWTITIEAVGN